MITNRHEKMHHFHQVKQEKLIIVSVLCRGKQIGLVDLDLLLSCSCHFTFFIFIVLILHA